MLAAAPGQRLFTGEHAYRVDSQRRIGLPVAWRGEGDDERSFMLLPHEDSCLQMMPMTMFAKLLPRIEEELLCNPAALAATGSLAGTAAAVTVDKQGRFGLTPGLMAYAGITDRVILVGGFLTIGLWSPEAWERQRQTPDQANRVLRLAATRVERLGAGYPRALGAGSGA